MTEQCRCSADSHKPKIIVLTGGPSAGKTRLLESIRASLCPHVGLLPEAASIVFGGGFPRKEGVAARRAAQRAIYHVQDQLERMVKEEGSFGIVLCDRGTLDGVAYWPDREDSFFAELATARNRELSRYAAVLHLRTPSAASYDFTNALRIESPAEAAAIDDRIASAWRDHPHRTVIDSTATFEEKIRAAIVVVRAELPACCLAADVHGKPGCADCVEVSS